MTNRLLEDYKQVQKNITDILDGTEPNMLIIQPHYIQPTIMAEKRDFLDIHGSLKYYIGISNTLVKALSGDNLTKKDLPSHAPPYLSELVKEKAHQ